jgi:hypothetical protein
MSHELDRRVLDLEREIRKAHRRTRTIAISAVALTLVAIFHDTRTAAQKADARVTAPFEVVDDRGRVVFRVNDDGWSLMNANGKPVVAASSDEGIGGLTVAHVARAGNATQLTFTDDGRPKVELLLGSRVVAELGATVEAGTLALSTAKAAGLGDPQPILHLGQSKDGVAFFKLNDPVSGELHAQLRSDKEGGRVEVSRSGKTAARLSATQNGGTVSVLNAQGAVVGGLIASARGGGGVALTGPAGGESAVSLSVTPGGGSLRLFPVGGGTARAELAADGPTGVLSTYNEAGMAVATMSSRPQGGGMVQISRSDGTTVVEAGASVDGVGVVRTGPVYGGPVGNLTVPYQIVGRKGR